MEQIWAAMNSSQTLPPISDTSISMEAAENQSQQHEALIKALNLIRKTAPLIINKFRPFSLLPSQETTNPTDHPDSSTTAATTILDDDQGVYIKGDDNDSDDLVKCVICLYEIVKGEKYRVLEDCKHGFHVECIDGWLQNNPSCPICRRPVAAKQPQLSTDHQALGDNTVLSSFLALVDHLWRWFINPLGFDDESGCDHQDDPNYFF